MEKVITGFINYNKPVQDICLCKHAMKEFGGFQLYPEKE
jgi:5'-methylthioadenosine phosphorylase